MINPNEDPGEAYESWADEQYRKTHGMYPWEEDEADAEVEYLEAHFCHA